MNVNQAFDQLETQLSSSQSMFDKSNGPMRVGQRFVDLLKNALANIDLSSITKDEFLKKVSGLYDSFVAPMILQVPAGVLVNAAVKQIVLTWAGNFYDKHSKPATA